MSLRRFWIEFEGEVGDGLPAGVLLGCGVTARDYEDALGLVRSRVFEGDQLPRIAKVVEDIDISTLDQGYVVPNMGLPTARLVSAWLRRLGGSSTPHRPPIQPVLQLPPDLMDQLRRFLLGEGSAFDSTDEAVASI